MDLLRKIDMMVDTTVAGDVAVNNAKGKIDVIGGECPKGTVYDKVKKVCVPVKNEAYRIQVKGITHDWMDAYPNYDPKGETKGLSKQDAEKKMKKIIKAGRKKTHVRVVKEATVVGGVYVNGTSNIAGSGQTRIVGRKWNEILDLARKEPVEIEMDDPTDTNIIGRKGLKFDKESGAYVPSLWGKDE